MSKYALVSDYWHQKRAKALVLVGIWTPFRQDILFERFRTQEGLPRDDCHSRKCAHKHAFGMGRAPILKHFGNGGIMRIMGC